MLEMKITITAPELSEAINNLARSLTGRAEITSIGTGCATHSSTAGAAAEEKPLAAPVAPVNPTPAPTVSTQAAGAPLSATPAPTVAPVVPAVPVAAPAPAAAVANNAPAPAVPTAAPQYTLDMIAKAGTALVDAGKMDELTGLLTKYGVAALTELDPTHYGAFAAELRGLGAQI